MPDVQAAQWLHALQPRLHLPVLGSIKDCSSLPSQQHWGTCCKGGEVVTLQQPHGMKHPEVLLFVSPPSQMKARCLTWIV